MKKFAYLSCLIMVSLILAACQVVVSTPTLPAEVTEDQGLEATLEVLLTQQAATIESLTTMVAPTASPVAVETDVTPEPTAVPEVTVIPIYTGDINVIESGGLVFNLQVEVAAGADVTTVLPDDPNEGWSEFSLPARRMVNFSGYIIQDHFHTPVIYVYAFDKLIQGGTFGATNAATLQGLLIDPELDLQAEGSLPFLPPFNAAQVFHVLEQRLDSVYNSGIRYLTMYSQGIMGVTNYEIFYTYQGISADGRYYIAAVLPIHSSLLSDTQLSNEEMENIIYEYPQYVESIAELIRTENGGILTPSLEALDAMMMSFRVAD